jgi:maltose O-acetyltransferase
MSQKTELEKLENGEIYDYTDKEVHARKEFAIKKCKEYNSIDTTDNEGRWKYLYEWLGSIGKGTWVASTFNCDYGKNIFLGSNITMNFNVTILDIRKVTIGDNVMIGPGTLITSVGHPLSPKGRREHQAFAKPVNIENDVWIGGNVVILPGINIGRGSVIGAGSVVTKDIPAFSVAVGSPARVIKTIENDLDN